MMKLKTGAGKTIDVGWIALTDSGNQVMIYFNDSRPLSEIAAEFDGKDKLEKTDVIGTKTITETYEGYTHMSAIQEMGRGTVLITLEKP